MAGILTKGIKLSYKKQGSTYEEISNLQECPDLGGTAEKVDVTVLADGNKKYINGVKDSMTIAVLLPITALSVDQKKQERLLNGKLLSLITLSLLSLAK